MGTFSIDSIKEILKHYLSNWKYFVVSMICCMVVALVVIRVSKPLFKTEAKVIIVDNSAGGLGSSLMKQFSFGGMLGSGPSVNDEIVRMTSYSLMRGVVKDLSLNEECVVKTGFLKKKECHANAPIDVICNDAILDTLRSSFEFRVKVDEKGKATVDLRVDNDKLMKVHDVEFPILLDTKYGEFTLVKTPNFISGKDLSAKIFFTGYDAATERYQDEIGVYIPNKKSDMVALEMINTDFKFSQEVLNTLIAAYNERSIEDEKAELSNFLTFVDARIDSAYAKLEYYETVIEAYKKERGITEVTADVAYLMEKRGKVEALLLEAGTNVEILKMTKEFISNPENKYALVPLMVDSESLATLITSYNEMVLYRMKLENNAKSNNVTLQQLNEQIDAMRTNIIASIGKAYENALVKYNELKSQDDEQKNLIAKLPTQEHEIVVLRRNQGLQQELYLFMLQQREEMAFNIANTTSKGRILDQAYTLTETVGISKKYILVLFFLLGLILPVAYSFLKDKLKGCFSSSKELANATSLPILGEVADEERETVNKGDSIALSEAFKSIRNKLLYKLDGKKKSILVTSIADGDGKTSVAVGLAKSIAKLGYSTLIVDLNLNNPSLGIVLNAGGRGLTDSLSSGEDARLDRNEKNTDIANLNVLNAGTVQMNLLDMIQSERLTQLVDDAKDRYDYVIMDGSSVGHGDDLLAMRRLSDAIVCVCRADSTKVNDIVSFDKFITENQLSGVQLIVNCVEQA